MSLIFDKKFKLDSSDKFDDYMKALGKSYLNNIILISGKKHIYIPNLICALIVNKPH